ncbi:MAG: PstS family phosphate ABC transporter substrate-binding protein [Actinobacteria bacterium]|nr:PstS family phosphate ABC transporter substrate-binding protein [Actinomycetota bacterium]
MCTRTLRRTAAAAVLLVLVAAACSEDKSVSGNGDGGGSKLSGSISVDGSSTVAALTSAAAELFQQDNPDVQITVGTSGTGGGFKKFCAGETDMADASRPIKDDDEGEAPACEANGIEYEEIEVANDGIALVTNKENTWAECLTVEQLNKIWAPDSTVSNWNQVDPSFPDQKLTLFGAGTSSGTFDFFTDQINGEEGASRSDYNATEDDNVTVQGVEGDKGALGYFGLSYYEKNQDKLNVVEVDDGEGCVKPSTDTVQDGSYAPLSRPLFIYPSSALVVRPEGVGFVTFYIENSDEIAKKSLFVPLTAEQRQTSLDEVRALAGAGTTSST